MPDPDEQAREAGKEAVEETRRVLDAIERAMEGNDWRTAAGLYRHLGGLAGVGERACLNLVLVKANEN